MNVILSTDVPNLGEEGDIRNVARGYARNFLIPQKLVMPYTKESLSILESRREHIDQRREEKRKAALDVKSRLEGEDLKLEMPAGESGRLFGSVTSAAIADALEVQGISVERKRIDIPEKTIKQVGTTRVRVRLYGDEEAELKVVVTGAGTTKQAGATEQPKVEAAPAPVVKEPTAVAEPAAAEPAIAVEAATPAVEEAAPAVEEAAPPEEAAVADSESVTPSADETAEAEHKDTSPE
jgi:large subunit ribosomal protein L9